MGDWFDCGVGAVLISGVTYRSGGRVHICASARGLVLSLSCGPTEDGRQRAMPQSQQKLGPHDCELGQVSACAEGM